MSSSQDIKLSSEATVFDRSITRSSLATDLESFKLPLRTKLPPNDLLFIVFPSKSCVEPPLKMTPRDSGILLIEHKEFTEFKEFRDSCEPLFIIVASEPLDFRKDLVESDGLSNNKIVGKQVIGSNFKARETSFRKAYQPNSFGIFEHFLWSPVWYFYFSKSFVNEKVMMKSA